ncbi:MAG TPA: class I SAM-dependent methyltransferase [Chthonomonadales bacterium]|nr:class I SAM-dependent methyltransferase [Chthonomonadales bacterium]
MQPCERFTNRVEYYVKYRPRYPAALLKFCVEELGLAREHVIADIGSGTGFLSELFLEAGNKVIGVEPNMAMRAAAEETLGSNPLFRSVDGSAEATTLPDNSVDAIAAGQAFHWFEPMQARKEFRRIAKPRRLALLVWNVRGADSTPFMRKYEEILQNAAGDYAQVRHREYDTEGLRLVLGEDTQIRHFRNLQSFDLDGLIGRLLSSSYAPLPDHSNWDDVRSSLEALFHEHQTGGRVEFEYDTQLFYSRLPGG